MQPLRTRASVERWVYPWLIWLCFILSVVTAESADPVVSHMVARQIDGGRQVEITYDVADADGDTLWVSVQVSEDGGVTYSVPAWTFEGDIGRVMPGRGKQVIWYVESDVDRAARGRFEVKVVASDLRPEVMVNTPAETVHEMILVPEGSFQMGTEHGEDFERPVHTVFLDVYRIDKFEVTNAQIVAFLNAVGRNTDPGGNRMLDLVDNDAQVRQSGSQFELKSPAFAHRPVVEVSWYGARAYCEWIGGRLPTEAEWERAARGLDGRKHPWGNRPPHSDLLNYEWQVGQTSDVGAYPDGVSPSGAYDMAGNVWEWTADWYDPEYYSWSPNENPRGPREGTHKTLRGGSWLNFSSLVRSTHRFKIKPGFTDRSIGFRCVRWPQLEGIAE